MLLKVSHPFDRLTKYLFNYTSSAFPNESSLPKNQKCFLTSATGMAGYLHQKHLCISRAVDTIELLRRAFVKNLEIINIAVGTEKLIKDEGQKSNVSTIEITVTKTRSK